MSLRAIKNKTNTNARQSLYKKSTHSRNKQNLPLTQKTTEFIPIRLRRFHSNPELKRNSAEALERLKYSTLLRTKSEDDIKTLKKYTASELANLQIPVKSEVCLHTITSRNYDGDSRQPVFPDTAVAMIGARSHRDLQSTYAAQKREQARVSSLNIRHMSESSLNSAYSQRMSAMSSTSSHDHGASIPIIGYEVIEERARFTVYKLRVENPASNDCWLVLRRYTDFVRLNNKLKQTFPHIPLILPRKKIFGDNFNSVFLDNRVQGLQIFVNSVMAKDELRKNKMVREFFCLDEPPSYSESMEECRAIFEAQEETIAHLKMQISSKNDLILSLQHKLRDEVVEKESLNEKLKYLESKSCVHCASHTTIISDGQT